LLVVEWRRVWDDGSVLTGCGRALDTYKPWTVIHPFTDSEHQHHLTGGDEVAVVRVQNYHCVNGCQLVENIYILTGP
jgi:hypothetical protein